MKAKQAANPQQGSESRSHTANLDTRYGRIGISAVAAALRCKGEPRYQAPASGSYARHYESD